MHEEVQKIAVLLVFGMALVFLNLKAGSTWLKFVSLWVMIAAFVAAGYLIVGWVFFDA